MISLPGTRDFEGQNRDSPGQARTVGHPTFRVCLRIMSHYTLLSITITFIIDNFIITTLVFARIKWIMRRSDSSAFYSSRALQFFPPLQASDCDLKAKIKVTCTKKTKSGLNIKIMTSSCTWSSSNFDLEWWKFLSYLSRSDPRFCEGLQVHSLFESYELCTKSIKYWLKWYVYYILHLK